MAKELKAIEVADKRTQNRKGQGALSHIIGFCVNIISELVFYIILHLFLLHILSEVEY